MGTSQDLAEWARNNKLRAIGGLWATGLVASLGYQMTRPIPISLAIIHSRVYAQAITLAALAAAGSAHFFGLDEPSPDAQKDKI
ncbi:hypothetical protein ACKKBG_A28460 [Auxenochlorella protothecoides x Auxenochlorella symbiontica]